MRALVMAVLLGAIGCVGPVGPRGDAGESVVPVSSLRCATLWQGPNGAYAGLEHDVHRYSDGSALVVCSVRDSNKQSTWVTIYSAKEMAATNGACVVGHDVDGPASDGQWTFVLNPASNTSVATYSDAGAGLDGTHATLRCGYTEGEQ